MDVFISIFEIMRMLIANLIIYFYDIPVQIKGLPVYRLNFEKTVFFYTLFQNCDDIKFEVNWITGHFVKFDSEFFFLAFAVTTFLNYAKIVGREFT